MSQPTKSEIAELLQTYPFKQYQYAKQQYDQAGLVDFHLKQVLKKLEAQVPSVFLPGADGMGWFCLLSDDPWWSKLFARKTARLDYFLGDFSCDDPLRFDEFIGQIKNKLPELGFQLAALKLDHEAFACHQRLTSNNFIDLGTSYYLGARRDLFADLKEVDDYCSEQNGVTLRSGEGSDLNDLMAIARASHEQSFFMRDPDIPESLTKEIFPLWIERCLSGPLAEFLVAKSGDELLGFISLMENRPTGGFTDSTFGIIDFIAVSPSAQGHGIGRRLLEAGFSKLLAKGADWLVVRTMESNYRALNLYLGYGFQLLSADRHYHFHS